MTHALARDRIRGLSWLASLCFLALPVHADDVRQRVRDHLGEALDDAPPGDRAVQPRPPRPAQSRSPSRPVPAASDEGSGAQFSFRIGSDVDAVPAVASTAVSPELPRRVFGEQFQADLKLGTAYRGWYPQQYENVQVDVAGYHTWSLDARVRVFKWLNIRRAYYETNALRGPQTREAAIAASVGSHVPKAAWLLGVLGFPIFDVWEPTIRYESRAFNTRAHAAEPVCLVKRSDGGDLSSCETTQAIKVVSSVETLVAGMRYNAKKDSSPVVRTSDARAPDLFFGVGLLSYTKPYQLTVEGQTLNDLLFDGRFRGAGAALGLSLAGGPDQLFAEIDAQLGLGEVSLTRGITVNSLAPKGWLIGYLQGNMELGYRWPLLRATAPTLMLVPAASLGGAMFFFFDTEPAVGEQSRTPLLNWDLFWSAQLSLELPL